MILPAYGLGEPFSSGSNVMSQLVGAGVTTSVLYIRKFGPYMYGTPYTLPSTT